VAGGSWWDASSNLRGLFPAILSAASQGASTAGVWQAIRDAADNTAESVLNVTLGRTPTDDEVTSYASNILSGIDAASVSQARGAAGQMVTAHENLINTPIDDQIDASAIARPPWAITTNNPVVQEQYRIRINWNVETTRIGTHVTNEWATYNLSGPITSVADALGQAQSIFAGADYNRASQVTEILDYTIEAV